ncbi:MAG: serine/threonine-protein kinase [Candidatus Eisenbacteria bacterium]
MESGDLLGHYEILEKLGQGGMGVVYKARDTKLDRPAALKVLPPALMKDEERRRRFIQEARAASAVNHPAIAQIYGIETVDQVPGVSGLEGEGLTFIAMEFVDGATVRQLIQRNELDVLSAIEVGIQVAGALQRAHEAGIVHRDIKSDNIMVTHDGHPKVLDFGLAKLVDPTDSSAPGESVNDLQTMVMRTGAMTQVGAVIGTVAYMSPEQARGLPADQRSDIFSFGIVLYEMATGTLPFQGESALDTMHAIAFGETRPLSDLRAGLPYSLQKVVNRCLEKDATKRFASMADVESELREVKRELESGVTRSAPMLDRAMDKLRDLTGGRASREGISNKGLVFLVVWSIILVTLIIIVLANNGGIGGVAPFLVIGAFVYRRFRTKRSRSVRKFSNKAKKDKAIRLISSDGDTVLIVLDHAPAKTFLKLNSLLESTNGGLYSGEPLELEFREGVDEEGMRELLTRPGLLYVRDAE